jgi:hypothetical protein
MDIYCKSLIAKLILLLGCNSALAGQYVRVSPDLELYYEEAGSGRPLILVTGRTATGEFFAPHQISHFSKQYRVLAYDPRSHGCSSKTLEGHTYLQHSKDLRAFMEALKLKDPIVVGWSWECHDIYGYFRRMEPTMSAPSSASIRHRGHLLPRRVIGLRSVMQRKMTQDEIAWALDQTQTTPNYVAVLLGVDGSFADYTEEARKIDGKIPVLNVLGQGHAARRLTRSSPN